MRYDLVAPQPQEAKERLSTVFFKLKSISSLTEEHLTSENLHQEAKALITNPDVREEAKQQAKLFLQACDAHNNINSASQNLIALRTNTKDKLGKVKSLDKEMTGLKTTIKGIHAKHQQFKSEEAGIVKAISALDLKLKQNAQDTTQQKGKIDKLKQKIDQIEKERKAGSEDEEIAQLKTLSKLRDKTNPSQAYEDTRQKEILQYTEDNIAPYLKEISARVLALRSNSLAQLLDIHKEVSTALLIVLQKEITQLVESTKIKQAEVTEIKETLQKTTEQNQQLASEYYEIKKQLNELNEKINKATKEKAAKEAKQKEKSTAKRTSSILSKVKGLTSYLSSSPNPEKYEEECIKLTDTEMRFRKDVEKLLELELIQNQALTELTAKLEIEKKELDSLEHKKQKIKDSLKDNFNEDKDRLTESIELALQKIKDFLTHYKTTKNLEHLAAVFAIIFDHYKPGYNKKVAALDHKLIQLDLEQHRTQSSLVEAKDELNKLATEKDRLSQEISVKETAAKEKCKEVEAEKQKMQTPLTAFTSKKKQKKEHNKAIKDNLEKINNKEVDLKKHKVALQDARANLINSIRESYRQYNSDEMPDEKNGMSDDEYDSFLTEVTNSLDDIPETTARGSTIKANLKKAINEYEKMNNELIIQFMLGWISKEHRIKTLKPKRIALCEKIKAFTDPKSQDNKELKSSPKSLKEIHFIYKISCVMLVGLIGYGIYWLGFKLFKPKSQAMKNIGEASKQAVDMHRRLISPAA